PAPRRAFRRDPQAGGRWFGLRSITWSRGLRGGETDALCRIPQRAGSLSLRLVGSDPAACGPTEFAALFRRAVPRTAQSRLFAPPSACPPADSFAALARRVGRQPGRLHGAGRRAALRVSRGGTAVARDAAALCVAARRSLESPSAHALGLACGYRGLRRSG